MSWIDKIPPECKKAILNFISTAQNAKDIVDRGDSHYLNKKIDYYKKIEGFCQALKILGLIEENNIYVADSKIGTGIALYYLFENKTPMYLYDSSNYATEI